MKKNKYDVICIGAALVDMAAQVKRHPANDDEVFVSHLELFSGGAAANTADACAKLGLETAFLGKIGRDDQFGKKIVSDFKNTGVHLDLLKKSENFGTGSAYVAVDPQGDRRIYAHSGAADKLSKEDIISEEIIQNKILYLSSLKNTRSFVKAALIAQNHDIPVILNPGMLIVEQGFTKIKRLLENIDILIISRREFKKLMELEKIEKENLIKKGRKLFNLGIQFLVITMGKEGAMLLNSDQIELFSPYSVKKVEDTTGAGDAFSAGLIYAFHSTHELTWTNMMKCVKMGNYIASSCIQEFGARNGIPDSSEIPEL